MASWLDIHSPRRFDELALPAKIISQINAAACNANPPHLLIAGPSGVGKTATWRLIARQVLGPGWNATTHVIQARDLVRSSGAMAKFEDFLRPDGRNSKDTLAGRTSLDAFDRGMITPTSEDIPPAGKESQFINQGLQMAPVSRLIIIEDADFLGPTRQPYLRRMMERESHTSRFIFTARAPSRLIDALRSRTQLIRLPSVSKELLTICIDKICKKEKIELVNGLLGDICHVVNGNLRRAIFLLELLVLKGMHGERNSLQKLIAATTLGSTQRVLEQALRGKIHEWRWEKIGAKNVRVLHGAMGQLDSLMNNHSLQPEDVIDQLHEMLVSGRLLLPEGAHEEIIDNLAQCDVKLQRSMHARIQFELLFHRIAAIGLKHGLAMA